MSVVARMEVVTEGCSAPSEFDGLFVEGRVSPARRVAIIGARAASGYGVHWAREIAAGLARAGFVIVSGGARGIDIAAHRAAIAAGGETIAVLGTGIDVAYPREHARDFREIAAHGALVSAYPHGTTARAHHFPERNRIIARLSEAVVVVEGTARSGALITARHARVLGRQVFAVPGDVGSPLSEAPHRLIAEGAAIVQSVSRLIAQIGGTTARESSDPIATAIRRGANTVEQVAAALSKPLGEVAVLLGEQEIAGRIRRVAGARFVVSEP